MIYKQNYNKRGVKKSAKKLMTAVLAAIIAVAVVCASSNSLSRGLSIVNAGGRSGDYGIREAYDDSERTYPNAVFGDDYFDANGKITLEFKAVSGAGEYTLLVQDETAKKVYLNSNYWGFNNETYHISYLIINNEKLVKCNGTSVVLSKSDFKKNADMASTYGEKYADVTRSMLPYFTPGNTMTQLAEQLVENPGNRKKLWSADPGT